MAKRSTPSPWTCGSSAVDFGVCKFITSTGEAETGPNSEVPIQSSQTTAHKIPNSWSQLTGSTQAAQGCGPAFEPPILTARSQALAMFSAKGVGQQLTLLASPGKAVWGCFRVILLLAAPLNRLMLGLLGTKKKKSFCSITMPCAQVQWAIMKAKLNLSIIRTST